MKIFKKIVNFWNDYFSITHFSRGYRAGMDAGLEYGGVLCKEALRSNNEDWIVALRRINCNIPITKGLADGGEIRKKLQKLIEGKLK